MDKLIQLKLRLPIETKRKLDRQVKKSGKSLNEEIILRLKVSFIVEKIQQLLLSEL